MNGPRDACVGSFVLALLAALVCSGPTQEAPPARVSFLEGSVVAREAGGPRELAVNEPLAAGTVLETATGSFAEIETAGGTFVRIGSAAAVRLDSLGVDSRITLISGALSASAPGARSRVSIGSRGERLLDGRGVVEHGALGRQDGFYEWSDRRGRVTASSAVVGEWSSRSRASGSSSMDEARGGRASLRDGAPSATASGATSRGAGRGFPTRRGAT